MAAQFFREAFDPSQCLRDVAAWGYPRPVSEEEAETATWVRYGEDVLAWFVPLPGAAVMLHVCASPEARGHLGTPRQMTALEVIAELMGATRLWVVTGRDGDFPWVRKRLLTRFLTHRGWTASPVGAYRELGVA